MEIFIMEKNILHFERRLESTKDEGLRRHLNDLIRRERSRLEHYWRRRADPVAPVSG